MVVIFHTRVIGVFMLFIHYTQCTNMYIVMLNNNFRVPK